MGNWWGPPIYPREDVDLPGYGVLSDQGLEAVIEASTWAWDNQQSNGYFGPYSYTSKYTNKQVYEPWNIVGYWQDKYTGKERFIQNLPWDEEEIVGYNPNHTIKYNNITPPGQAQDVFDWFNLLSQNGRTQYGNKQDWENAVRHWLNQHAVARDAHHGPAKTDFDPLTWRTWGDHFNNDFTGSRAADWNQLSDHLEADYPASKGGVYFPYMNDWSQQDTSTNIVWTHHNHPPPPPAWYRNGLGVTDFIVWVLKSTFGITLDWSQIFSIEYASVLVISLLCIIYTDLYPFFFSA